MPPTGRLNAGEKHKLINQSMSWHSAQTYCRTHYTDLSSVTSLEQNQQFQNTAKMKSFWTGLFRDMWIWSDGTNYSFHFWSSNELYNAVDAYEYCATIMPSSAGRWGDRNCGNEYPFLCYESKLTKQKNKIQMIVYSNIMFSILQSLHCSILKLRNVMFLPFAIETNPHSHSLTQHPIQMS